MGDGVGQGDTGTELLGGMEVGGWRPTLRRASAVRLR